MRIKASFVIPALLALLTITGCSTTKSPQGGISTVNEQFSFTVPSSSTVPQGGDLEVLLKLNRGDYFKQDVVLVVRPQGLAVTPETVLIKASEKPEVKLHFSAPHDAALGKYNVLVAGTPETGESTKTEFVIEVVGK